MNPSKINLPKFILSRKVVLQQYATLHPLADIVSYSSKTNPKVTPILEKETDCLFSIHLLNELQHIQDKSRVVFLAQGWDEQQIKQLCDMQVRFFVVDNGIDLQLLLDYVRKHQTKIKLLLRAKLRENTINTERYFAFGMNSFKVNEEITKIRADPQLNACIEQLGVHFHRKTQNLSEWNLVEEFNEIIDEQNLSKIDVVNIGGGLPSEYANTNVKVFNSILAKIAEFKQYANEHNLKLMLEPGRFIAAPAGKLVASIVRIYENNIIINASVYNADLDALIVPVKLKVEGELDENSGKPYVVKGLTPCSMDLFRYRVYLNNPQEGDKIVFLNAGAYNFSTNFCDLEEIKTEVVE